MFFLFNGVRPHPLWLFSAFVQMIYMDKGDLYSLYSSPPGWARLFQACIVLKILFVSSSAFYIFHRSTNSCNVFKQIVIVGGSTYCTCLRLCIPLGQAPGDIIQFSPFFVFHLLLWSFTILLENAGICFFFQTMSATHYCPLDVILTFIFNF